MKHITATPAFRSAAEAINLPPVQDFEPVPDRPNIRRLSTLPEDYPKIIQEFESEGLSLRYDAGPDVVWVKGSPYIPDGRVGVCIILPEPKSTQNEREIAGCSDFVNDTFHKVPEQEQASSDLAVTLEPAGTTKPPAIDLGQVEIGRVIPGGGGLSAMAKAQWGAGNIIVLNPYEYLRAGRGVIAMIFIRYKTYQLIDVLSCGSRVEPFLAGFTSSPNSTVERGPWRAISCGRMTPCFWLMGGRGSLECLMFQSKPVEFRCYLGILMRKLAKTEVSTRIMEVDFWLKPT
ncbi:hypothetical protein CEP54_015104 [Fusarium duplospermum]|uniref:Uncharacterized protein n=1 Tax=Fusarium duplospermum TaxID=1325734 RepID=A0A428NRG9_9HYPO|nr:hypothetical protein CEP54_015104 [Fusarium duplospermum]